MMLQVFAEQETVLSETPEYRSARDLEIAALEMDNEIAQDLDRIEVKKSRARAWRELARDLRRRAFERSTSSLGVRHVG